ncbi:response regulator transcription factor [Thermosulfuriphilus ammonigenes]|uniref:Response regulator transcription factor n=1 Tax=Thermosulfuriphilus ammonigenes TaxID=1936021 RepID=A0A6G7PYE0_9BACT|nr:response regulator transcription factor [Thermosulfuriphilus ammonigenes]MBA2849021.1 two-component system alkaline phosphatase synthesis response regulator PhoP/OmpR family response regulator RpaB [Thermosulfuriphilus ammonigenes]QIJ72709.1 response regulator transcription factor [Thermosulfuriphilus ammonigenes]
MSKPEILIVEDEKDILSLLKDQLELDDFRVFGVTSGLEALEFLEEHHPDLIILDLNLPDIDGLKVCRQIREKTQVPIIMVTARDSLSDKLRGFEAGADDYLTKPFEYLELLVRIRARLKRTADISRKESLQFGPLKIIPSKRQVYLNGRPVKLTKKEYDLLEILASQPGEVLSRDFIRSQLWPDKEIYPWSRALDVHIQRLRQKIEPDPEHPRFIITHPGVGYRFEPGEEEPSPAT